MDNITSSKHLEQLSEAASDGIWNSWHFGCGSKADQVLAATLVNWYRAGFITVAPDEIKPTNGAVDWSAIAINSPKHKFSDQDLFQNIKCEQGDFLECVYTELETFTVGNDYMVFETCAGNTFIENDDGNPVAHIRLTYFKVKEIS